MRLTLVTWQREFAWWPVRVDAYDVSQVRNGRMSFYVWLVYVESAYFIINDDYEGRMIVKRYRLAQ